jgi:hypothetical protein
LLFRGELENLTNDDWAGYRESVTALFFETNLHQFGHDRIWSGIGRKVYILGKPRQWNAH